MRIIYVGLVFALAAGCVTQKGDDSTSTDGGDGSGSGSNHGSDVTPQVGTWHYAQVTPVSNTCNPMLQHGEQGDFLIDAAQATSFHVIPGDGLGDFTCTLASGMFDCPNRAAFVQDYHPTVDAVITVHVAASGTFSDATHGTGLQQATVDCVGTQCAAIGTPCTFSQNFAIVAI
jgi:hypothetical protein